MSARRGLVEFSGGVASYREAGSGITAIVTAGLGLTSRFYKESYAAFAAAGIHLIVPDLPGWGETPGPHTGLRPADSAAFLIELARALGIRRAVFIGHSLGAQAIVQVAERRPDLAAALVLVGPTGAPGRFELLRQAWGLAVEARRTSASVIAAVAREYVSASPARYIGTWLRHSRDELPARLPRIQCPALILAGDADPVCRPEFIELLRHRMPHAAVEWVRGGTHALPRGHAEEFNRRVIRFIRDSVAP
ncbi:MAG TPA: alpha/beta hydrolase [Longimicrobiales bacterium]|nr:alpha/beta hydrolase [Longimicrobiales bacterium]